MSDYTRLRPHWRPTHQADPIGFGRWIGPDGANGWVKILNPDGHLCRQVWRVAPYARLCLRLHPMSEQQAELLSDPFGLGIAHADQWRRWLSDQGVSTNRVACEGLNESPIWNPGVIQAHNVYADSYARAMRERGLTAVIGNINTGWPGNTGPDTPVDWSPLTPTLHAVRTYGHFLGLHSYWDARGIEADWGWNPGRFTQLPREFANLPLLITECGYDRAVNAPSGTGNHGWQGELSVDTYMAQLTEYDRRIRAYANLEAAFIFTHDFDEPWGTWNTVPLLDRLCGHAEWVRVQPTPTRPETPGGAHVIRLPTTPNDGPTPQQPTAETPEPQPIQPGPGQRQPARDQYKFWFEKYGNRYGIPWNILAALAYFESAYNPQAISSAGAMGMMQFMPGTWADMQTRLGVTDAYDAEQSIKASAAYLSQIRGYLPAERKTWSWILAGYNAGPGRASTAAWETLPPETRQYARDIQQGAELLRRWEESF